MSCASNGASLFARGILAHGAEAETSLPGVLRWQGSVSTYALATPPYHSHWGLTSDPISSPLPYADMMIHTQDPRPGGKYMYSLRRAKYLSAGFIRHEPSIGTAEWPIYPQKPEPKRGGFPRDAARSLEAVILGGSGARDMLNDCGFSGDF